MSFLRINTGSPQSPCQTGRRMIARTRATRSHVPRRASRIQRLPANPASTKLSHHNHNKLIIHTWLFADAFGFLRLVLVTAALQATCKQVLPWKLRTSIKVINGKKVCVHPPLRSRPNPSSGAGYCFPEMPRHLRIRPSLCDKRHARSTKKVPLFSRERGVRCLFTSARQNKTTRCQPKCFPTEEDSRAAPNLDL